MRKRLLGVLATGAILVSACQSAASPSPTSSTPAASTGASAPASAAPSGPLDVDSLLYGANYAPATGTKGGKVIIGEWQAPDQQNYYFSNAFANSEVLALTTRSGLVVSADGHYMPDLFAKNVTFKDNVKKDASGDGYTVHVDLKPNLKWSDGQPLTGNDFKFTQARVTDKDQSGIATLGWENIDKVDVASDGLGIDFHYPKPFGGWLGTIGGNPPLPEHYFKSRPVKDDNKAYPLSADIANAPVNGAFKYQTASPDTIELVRNDNFENGKACAPVACLDAVTFKSYPDNKDGMIAAFKTGDVDLALDMQTADFAAIQDVDPAVGKALLAPGWEYEHLDFNQSEKMGAGATAANPALKDPVVRKAIAQAINKQDLWKTVFPGTAVPQADACQSGVPGLNYWALPQEEAKCPTFDVDAANSALDGAGYTKGSDGIRVDPKTNKPLVLEHCTSNVPVRKTSGDFIAQSLQKIGIKMNPSYVDSTKVFFATWAQVDASKKCNLYHGTYDTAEYASVLSFDLFGDYYYNYATEQIPTDENKGNGYNSLHLSDPDVDKAIETLKSEMNIQNQLEAAYDIQKIVDVNKVYEVPLYYRGQVRGVSTRLQNFFQNPGTASDMWNAQDWFVTQ
jgi:peptide/nickel transport system substrate-binding protein